MSYRSQRNCIHTTQLIINLTKTIIFKVKYISEETRNTKNIAESPVILTDVIEMLNDKGKEINLFLRKRRFIRVYVGNNNNKRFILHIIRHIICISINI